MKKEVFDMVKNGNAFKLIIHYDILGNIFCIMEKPNLNKINSDVLTSGSHVFSNSLFNHIDFYLSGALAYREYPVIRGSTNYGYNISGGVIIV
jgi:hypothetical protein